MYRISDRVEVDPQGKGKYLSGTVTKLRLDGTFDVELDNGDVARQVDFDRIRKTSRRRRRHDDNSESEDEKEGSKSPSSRRRRKESSRKRNHDEEGKDDDEEEPKYPSEPAFRSGNTHILCLPFFLFPASFLPLFCLLSSSFNNIINNNITR